MSKPVFVRGLLPQDLKIEIEQLSRDEGMKVARFLAAAVGKAHSRQMDVETRNKWLKHLQRNREPTLSIAANTRRASSLTCLLQHPVKPRAVSGLGIVLHEDRFEISRSYVALPLRGMGVVA